MSPKGQSQWQTIQIWWQIHQCHRATSVSGQFQWFLDQMHQCVLPIIDSGAWIGPWVNIELCAGRTMVGRGIFSSNSLDLPCGVNTPWISMIPVALLGN